MKTYIDLWDQTSPLVQSRQVPLICVMWSQDTKNMSKMHLRRVNKGGAVLCLLILSSLTDRKDDVEVRGFNVFYFNGRSDE